MEDAQRQFSAQGDRLEYRIIKLDGSAEAPVTAQLVSATYDAVLIGGACVRRMPISNCWSASSIRFRRMRPARRSASSHCLMAV